MRKIDDEVIQVEGENYWEAKSRLLRFGSYETSSGLWGMILVILNQQWMFRNTKTYGESVYKERVNRLISKSAFAFLN